MNNKGLSIEHELQRRVGCYVRVSTDNQIENYSIEEQIERLKAYCIAKDWVIYKFYTDAGYSGGNLDRPALTQLLQDIQTKRINMIAVYKLDRLSRSQKDTLTLIEDKFLANNVDFVSMSENFDTSTPFGKAMIGILSVFAQLEKDQITERFTMGRIGRSKAGYYHGGPTPPTGYDYIDGKLKINEYKALQVKEVFQRFLSGESVNSIQKHMNEKYGGWNSHPHILYVLRNSVYIGKVKFKKREYDGLHQPIIDKSDFKRVQYLLNSSKREASKTTVQKTPFRAGYMLSSLIRCAHCGARYSANHGYYKCYSRSKSSKRFIKDADCKNKNWKIDELDNLIISEIKKLKYEGLNDLITTKQPSKNNNSIKTRVKEIDNQISKLIDLYQISGIPLNQVQTKIAQLQKEKNVLSAELMQASKKDLGKTFSEALKEVDKTLKNGTIAEKRLLIAELIEVITIDKDNVNIKWRL